MSTGKTEPQRWRERQSGGEAFEDHVADLFRRVDVPVRFTPTSPPAPGMPASSGAGSGTSSDLSRLVRPGPLALVTGGAALVVVAAIALVPGERAGRPDSAGVRSRNRDPAGHRPATGAADRGATSVACGRARSCPASRAAEIATDSVAGGPGADGTAATVNGTGGRAGGGG